MNLDNFDIDSVILGLKKINKISIKNFLRFFLYHDLSKINNEKKLLITSDLNRHSYAVIFERIKILTDANSMAFTSKELKISFSLVNVLKAIKFYKKLKQNNKKDFLHTIAYITYAIRTIQTIDSSKALYPIQLISFMPLHGVENIIAQYVKFNGGSVSMYQHALYKNDVNLNELDKIIFNVDNYKYVDKILLWGHATYNELAKYIPENKLCIAGSPFLETNLLRDVKPKNVLLLLTTDNYNDYNTKLIDYMCNMPNDYVLYAKLHPNSKLIDNRVITLPKNISITDAIIESRCEFAVSVNSSSYYDMYRLGVRCFKYEVNGIRKLDSVLSSDSIYSDDYRFNTNIDLELDIASKLDYFYSKDINYR